MNRRDNEELTNIPKMTPARDELVERRPGTGRNARATAVVPDKSSQFSLYSLIAIVLAIAALGACYFLWDQSRKAQLAANSAESRIAGLEAQLTSTGDELSQSDAAVRVKLRELDNEVRKLWDSRKKANKLASEHDTSIKNLVTRTGKTRKDIESQISRLTGVAAELDEVVELLESSNFEAQSAALQAATTKVQQLSRELGDITSRVAANEEWVASINAFRKQVNERLNTSSPAVANQPALQ